MRQLGLFVTAAQPTTLVGDHGDVRYIPGFLTADVASALFDELARSTTWTADSRMMYGRRVLVPRETAARGADCPQPWSPALLRAKAAIEAQLETTFDYVFINRLRSRGVSQYLRDGC